MKISIVVPLAFIALPWMAPSKVTICHVLSDPPKTMDVPESALDNHLAHGDYRGPCVAPTATATITATTTITPTPTASPTPTSTPDPTDEPTPDPTDEPTPTPAPASTPEPSKIVIENMWLIRGVVTNQPFNRDYMRWKTTNYCILISDTHPSYEQQVAKCFPPFGWYPLGAPCAGPVYSNDVWACDDVLAERGWSRRSLADLCQRYPKWCDR